MTLIIRDELTAPPTWFASFRDLTLFSSAFLGLDIVIETPPELTDRYYYWLKRRGGMDFVDDFVRPGSEDGIRLDISHGFPRTILADRIVPENTRELLDRIRFVSNL